MNYQNEDITKRAEESALWKDLENQKGHSLPFLLERYLLLENWRYLDRSMDLGPSAHDVQFLHLLLAESVTVILGHEERIRKLEDALAANAEDQASEGLPASACSTLGEV